MSSNRVEVSVNGERGCDSMFGVLAADKKAIPAHLMGVKQKQKQSHCLHPTQSVRLHVAAMSLTGDEGSSKSNEFSRQGKIERDAARPKGSIICQFYYFYSLFRLIKP